MRIPFPAQFFPFARGALTGVVFAAAYIAAANATTGGPVTDPQFKRAVAAYAEDRLEEAQAAFEKLAQRFPDHPVVLNNLAVVAARRGDTETAIKLLKRVMASDATIHAGYLNLSSIYAHLASLSYREALSLEPDNPEPPRLQLVGEPQQAATEPSPAALAALQAREINDPLVRDPQSPVLSDRDRDVIAAVQRWARAWSDQNLAAYFASYVADYKPAGDSHRSWKRQRTRRVTAPRRIEVKISDVRARIEGDDEARVTFRQQYRSNLLSSSVTKRLHLRKIGDEWKITLERVL